MGKSIKFQSLLFKGVILVALLSLLGVAVGTVYAANSTDSSSSATSSQQSFDEQQESLWISRAQSLVARVDLEMPILIKNGVDVSRLQSALEDTRALVNSGGEGSVGIGSSSKISGVSNGKLSNGITIYSASPKLDSGRIDDRAFRAAIRSSYNQLRREWNQLRVAHPALFATASNNGLAQTGGTANACATAVPTAVPATGCAAPAAVVTATPVPTQAPVSGCVAPATGAMATETAVPAETATEAPMATATAAASSCGVPATGFQFSNSTQFQAFVWNNHAFTLLIRVRAAIASGKANNVDVSAMENDLPQLQALLNVPTANQNAKWVNDLQSAYWMLKRDFNQFRAANPSLVSTNTSAGVANTGGTSSTSASSCGVVATATAVPSTGSSCSAPSSTNP